MGRPDYRYCRQCGRPAELVGELSHVRLCSDCSRANLNDAYDQMQAHAGPVFLRWRHRIAASVGAAILDSPPQRS